MKKEPIHQNLNTSFVNVAALVRYLGGLQFVGSIRLELASYEADIVFTNSRTIQAREYDHIAGRISHGKQALQRILVRAREPHGRINVYRSDEGHDAGTGGSIFIDSSILSDARRMAGGRGGAASKNSSCEFIGSGRNGANAAMLRALSDVLHIIDESLAEANLSFGAAFRLACEAVSKDYAFLRLNRRALVYHDGSVFLNASADAATVASAVFAALRPIFRRLRNDEKYAALFRRLAKCLRELSGENRTVYLRLGLVKYIDELLIA
jgi:hypothetical protein